MNDAGRLRRLVALGTVAALGLLAIGVLLLRVSRPPSIPDAPSPSSTETQTPRSTSAPGGPTAERAGLPAGFTHDEGGAAAAAVSYAGASQRWLYWTDEEIAAAISEIATPESAGRLTEETINVVRTAREELAPSPGRVWWLVHPLAWRIQQYSSDQATVEVWTMRLLAASDVALPQTEWVTFTVDLDWVNGDWRLATVRDTPGPTPMTGPRDEPWQPEPFDEALGGFTRLDGEPVRAVEVP